MSEECTHDCSSCGADCPSRIQKEPHHPMAGVDKVYAVVSGKGGVGKSLVTGLLAVEMQRRGLRAAILDADITGPSIPRMFGIQDKAMGEEGNIYPVCSAGDVQVMSINCLLENDTDPVVWRGPIIAGVVKQFWTDVVWQDVDYMFVDMPPGTGDVPLTVMQSIPIDGIILVTSPQELVGMIVEKAAKMAGMLQVPIVGIVENMSYFRCPDCGKDHYIFGQSRVEHIAADYGIPHVARLPIDPDLAALCDHGQIERSTVQALADLADNL